jgi:hypothetical protein
MITTAAGAAPMGKNHLEFHRLDLESGWEQISGYPPNIRQKVLSSDLDERQKKGSRTRLLRFEAGAFTKAPFVHDHWEEVYLLEGELTVGSDTKGTGGEVFEAPTYACRPPGAFHGPFSSQQGCMLYELHYYDRNK